MKKYTYLFVVLLLIKSAVVYSKQPVTNGDSSRIVVLEDQLLDLRLKNKQLLDKLESKVEDDFIKKANVYITIATSLTAIFAFIGVFFGLRAFINRITENYLLKKVERELSMLIQQKYGEVLKEVELKKNSKILVINEKETSIPAIFKELMREFPLISYLDIVSLSDLGIETIITIANNHDLVILEDMVPRNRWLINTRNLPNETEQEKVELKNAQKSNKLNNNIIIEFIRKISPKTAFLYYGDGLLTKEQIGDFEIEQFVSFANAPATLNQNISNLLKLHNFNKELGNV